MLKGAYISKDGKYRYTLWRDWRKEGESTKAVAFIGLNPSTADADKDDPTIRRCIGFAKTWGFNKLIMVNLFAYRATNPKDMMEADDPEGSENSSVVRGVADIVDLTVAAWGAHGSHNDMDALYFSLLRDPHHLGLTKSGAPRHPLYLKLDTKPQRFKR